MIYSPDKAEIANFMKKFLISISILSTTLLIQLSTSVAFAQTVCQPIYGGGQICAPTGALLIDKKVINPQNNQFVDNLGVNDTKFQPLTPVFFKLAITNTGGTNLSNIVVRDVFPQFIDFSAGAGSFDTNSKTLNFTVDTLAPNETKTFDVVGRVVPNDQIPQDRGVICLINQAIATSGSISSQDNSQFCIEKVVPTPTPQPVVIQPVVQPVQPVIVQPTPQVVVVQPVQPIVQQPIVQQPVVQQPVIAQQPVVVQPQVPIETKGGLKVFPAPTAKGGTPATGPEALTLVFFTATGAAGIALRKISSLLA